MRITGGFHEKATTYHSRHGTRPCRPWPPKNGEPGWLCLCPMHYWEICKNLDHEDDKTSLIRGLLYAYQTMSPIYTVMICGATFIWQRFHLSKVYNEPFIGLSTRKTAVNTLEPAPPRDFYVSGRDSGRYQHVSYVIWRRIKQAEDENGVVKQRFLVRQRLSRAYVWEKTVPDTKNRKHKGLRWELLHRTFIMWVSHDSLTSRL